MSLPTGAKLIGISSITYIDKTGKRKTISAKKYKNLFKELTVIVKKAEKEGTLFKEHK